MTTQTTTFGAFSISLVVKDLAASRAFYGKLGFEPIAGDERSYLIVRNGYATLGLFQNVIPANTLTFNPGWDAACAPLAQFVDVHELKRRLASAGVAATTVGPAHFTIVDPDGNHILVDQHV
jgi:catechol 2,3-dioxygenase-like lactoylglutathione lyase family enzyme